MDTKSFVFGAACGAILAAAAGWLLSGNDENEVTANRGQEEVDSTIIQNAEPPGSTIPINQDTSKAAIQNTAEPPIADSIKTDSVSRWPANLREAFEAEPKDGSWAYYMEQAMLQYLSSHSSMAQFDISIIECRTTKCQIEVIGYDESTVPVWQQVMYDIRQQPWSEFDMYATSSGMIDGRLIIVGTLHRVQESN